MIETRTSDELGRFNQDYTIVLEEGVFYFFTQFLKESLELTPTTTERFLLYSQTAIPSPSPRLSPLMLKDVRMLEVR